MPNPITVKELKELLDIAVEAGYGNDLVQVSDNDEVTGYHFLYSHNFGSNGYNILYLD
jgi:hypothetical protein